VEEECHGFLCACEDSGGVLGVFGHGDRYVCLRVATGFFIHMRGLKSGRIGERREQIKPSDRVVQDSGCTRTCGAVHEDSRTR
jgi:hypothetical protein